MKDDFEKKLFKMAAREQMVLPKTLERKIELKLQSARDAKRPKKILNLRRSLILAAVLLTLFSITAFAAAGALKQRMEAMNKEKMEEYFVQIYSSFAGADNYNRSYTDSEKKRLDELRISYEEQGRFPEGELTMLDEVEDYKGKNVAFFKKTSTFFFPEKEMSDEQLLQIIDFYAKRDYSLQKMNEMIADKETDFPEEARPAVPQNPTDSAVLESSAAFQPDQALTIPYTGDLSIRAIAAGGDGILLAGRNAIHRMEIGSSDSVLFYDGFDENTQITELCEDGEGNVYAGLLKVTADGNYKVHLAVIDKNGSFLKEIDMSPYMKDETITIGGRPGNGYINRMMADNQYLYLRGINFQDADFLLIIDKDGNPVSKMKSGKYTADRRYSMCIGKDQKPYTVLMDENHRFGIAAVNPKEGTLEEIYTSVFPKDTISLNLAAPGYDADFVFWGFSGSFSLNLSEDAAMLVTPVYDFPCPTEGALYLALPDGRIVLAYCTEYRNYTAEDGEQRHERIPEKTCFYYLPAIRNP
ncbi:MAG: hypothetical protein K2P30_03805 [Lachnospiraceae bacterium]|nr:hypothetical protein [Lachnospiraceae bacterium]